MSRLTPKALAFSELILELFRLNRLLLDAGDTLAAPAGLTSARWQVLGVVEHGPTPVAQVARTIGLTRQNVQRIADELAAVGLIAYEPNPHHQRAKLMALTAEGRAALDSVQQRHAVWANHLAQKPALADVEPLLAQLRGLRALLEEDERIQAEAVDRAVTRSDP
jgi:DNA-binding MarR family transcriptional regulator